MLLYCLIYLISKNTNSMLNKMLLLTKLKQIKRIFKRNLISERHRKAWEKFENEILYYRSNAIFLFHIVHFLLTSISDESIYSQSEKYLSSDKSQFDTYNAIQFHPYVKMAFIIGNFMRIFLIIASIKQPKICKIYFHYECVMMLLDLSMPRDINLNTVNYILLLVNGLNFCALCYNFWVSLITACMQRIVFVIIRN